MVGPSPAVEGHHAPRAAHQPAVCIRPMMLGDVDEVVAIERESFSDPWTREMFRAELTENPCARFFVAVAGVELIGYIGGWMVGDELEVVSLAVRPAARRRGVASRLLAHLFEQARGRLRRACLEVRGSNQDAIAMYERFGFRPVGVRRGYYDEPKEDAVLMEWVA